MTLGGLALVGSAFTRPKPLLLLTYLALEGPQPKQHVAELFWPAAKERRRSLNVALWQLRRAEPSTFRTDRDLLAASVEADANGFLSLLDHGEAEAAWRAYRGAFLAGLRVRCGADLEDWVWQTREMLAGRMRHELVRRAEREARLRRYPRGASLAEQAIQVAGAAAMEPELLQRVSVLLLAGDRPIAPSLKQEATDLGVNVSVSKGAARARLARANPPASRDPSSLPVHGEPLIGRERESGAIVARLRDGARLVTLLGTAGVGKSLLAVHCARHAADTGAVAEALFAPLDNATDRSTLLEALAATLRTPGRPVEGTVDDIAATIADCSLLLVLDNFEQLVAAGACLTELLAHCPNLVLLVTSRERLHLPEEHTFPIEGLEVPQPTQAFDTASEAPAVELFRRHASRARPEFTLDADNLASVVAICRSVGGLPLAIEIAAAWLRAMSPSDLADDLTHGLERLGSRRRRGAARHRSVRDALDWSWRLMTAEDRQLFARLGVFRGGFRREAGRAVAGADLSGLAALVDKSMLRFGPGDRFNLHPLLVRYAQEKLEAGPEARAVRDAHAAYYLAMAESAAPRLTGPEQWHWLKRLEAEHENLRAASTWWETENLDRAVRLGAALWRYWILSARNLEGRDSLTRLARRTAGRSPSPVRATVLRALGTITFETGDFARAVEPLQAALADAVALGDDRAVADTHCTLGWVTAHIGRARRSRRHSEEALALSGRIGDLRCAALAENNLGFLSLFRGAFAAAREHLMASLRMFERLAEGRGIAHLKVNLAAVERFLGDYDGALEQLALATESLDRLGDKQLLVWGRYQQVCCALDRGLFEQAAEEATAILTLAREVGNRELLGALLTALGDARAAKAERGAAQAALREARAIWSASGYPWMWALTYRAEARVALSAGRNEDARSALREALALSLRIGDRHGVAEGLEHGAIIAQREDQNLELAVLLRSGAARLRRCLGAPQAPRFTKSQRAALEHARQRLGDGLFETVWREGQHAPVARLAATARLR